MDWDARLRFNASRPPADGLARLAVAVAGRRARVTCVRHLKGGVDAATHAVRLAPGGWIVLNRTVDTDPVSLAGEFVRLEVAQRVDVVTPQPIALDTDGEWFGRPALVMSLLPGRSVLHPDTGPWVSDLATALVSIHAAALPAAVPAQLRGAHAGTAWRPPDDRALRRNPRIDALIRAAVGLQEDLVRQPPTQVLLHHDFHHGNVVWQRGRLSGVADWNEARLGPAVCDAAYCSVDLAMTHGSVAADTFVRGYEAAADRPLEDLARWQALWLVNDMRWVGYWVRGLYEAGAAHLTLPLLRRRLRAYADRVLRRL